MLVVARVVLLSSKTFAAFEKPCAVTALIWRTSCASSSTTSGSRLVRTSAIDHQWLLSLFLSAVKRMYRVVTGSNRATLRHGVPAPRHTSRNLLSFACLLTSILYTAG